MNHLFELFTAKYARIDTSFIRTIDSEIDWSLPLIGIRGSRGIGKTTLLLQHIRRNFKADGTVLYASVDNIWFNGNSIYSLASDFAKRGGRFLFLDEVHKYHNWSQELKNIYDDLPELHVVFTGSSLLEILNSRADLSRRAVVYEMQGFSFREYLNWTQHLTLPQLSLSDITQNHIEIAMDIIAKTKILSHFDDYLRHGYYPFYRESPNSFNYRVNEIVNLILEIELPTLRGIEITYIPKIKQLLYIIAESAPFIPNINKLSERIGISRASIIAYLNALHESRITFNAHKRANGLSRLQKPDKLFLDNTNLSYAFALDNANKGTLRETFVANQLRYRHSVEIPEQGDFSVDGKYTFEVGGHNKQRHQIDTVENAYILSDNIEYGSTGRIPLWMTGMLY